MNPSDLELVRQFATEKSEAAFTQLVRRHVDLVYSAALRQVHSPQLAEEVAQTVFVDLAREAGSLTPDTILTAWLYQVTRRSAIDVVRRESRRQARERIATEMNALNATANDWTHIGPLLDDAMAMLDEADRAAVLLRYFENKSLREVGEALGTSDDAAQKRVSRAVERLREFFSKRGVSVGASGLVVVLSANAVQAAPAALAATISTAAITLTGTTIATATTTTLTKTIAMTTLQKSLVAATVAILAGTGIYQTRQAAKLRDQLQTLQQQDAPLAEQVGQLQQQLGDARNQLASMTQAFAATANDKIELLRLRAEVASLRRQKQLPAAGASRTEPDPAALEEGFGTLGKFVAIRDAADAGNTTPEGVVQTFLWAIREGKLERLGEFGAPFGGQREPGDTVGQISKAEEPIYSMMQNVFTNSEGFRLSSKGAADGQRYRVRLDAVPRSGITNELLKNFFLSFVLERKSDGWTFGDPSENPSAE